MLAIFHNLIIGCMMMVCSSQITSQLRIIEEPSDYVKQAQETATLVCKTSGNPKPTVTWHHAEDGRRVITAQDRPTLSSVTSSSSGTLIFLSIQKKDEGLYYCNASNINGWIRSRNASLQLAFLESNFEYSPQSKLTTVDSTVEMMCRPPRGIPIPKLTWKKNGKELLLSNHIKITNEGNLRIDQTVRSDSGSYTCIASNLAGKRESDQALLTVRLKPVFSVTPLDDLVKENDDTTFRCEAGGDPTPGITWKREDGTIPASRSRILSDGSLSISKVQLSDAGKYICVATSEAGSVEAVARLEVQTAPQFVLTPSNREAKEGDMVIFNCKAIGKPIPTIYWANTVKKFIFEGQSDDSGRRNVTSDGQLIISNVQKSDEGTYECHASSHVSFIHTSVQLTVRQLHISIPPIIEYGPQNLTLRESSNALLRCYVRTAIIQTSYQLEWFRNNKALTSRVQTQIQGDARYRQDDEGSLHIYNLRLSDRGNYTCMVTADDKSTQWTGQLHVLKELDTANEVKPIDIALLPHPPEAVQVTDKGADWMKVRWNPSRVPAQSPATNYRIELLSHETGHGWQIAADNVPAAGDGEGIIFIVKGLKPETSYQFVVRARNKDGLSKPSQLTSVVRTATSDDMPNMNPKELSLELDNIKIPNVRLKVINSKSIRVDWDVVNKKRNGYRLISGFHVNYKKVPLGRCTNDGGNHPDAPDGTNEAMDGNGGPVERENSFLDSTLTKRQSYCSLMHKHRTDYMYHLQQAVVLSADAENKDAHNDDPGFSIKVRSRITRKKNMVNTVIDNLIPFQCYMVTIYPYFYHRMYGEIRGGWSKPEAALTFDEPPSQPPINIKANWADNSSVIVSWQPPYLEPRNGVLLGYNIHVLANDSKTHRIIEVRDIHRHNVTVRGLSANIRYTIHLACVNCKGEGIRSEALVLRRITSNQSSIVRQPLFIAGLVGGIIIWFMCCSLAVYGCYYKCGCCYVPYKRNSLYKTYVNGSLTMTERCNMHPLLKQEQPVDSSSCASRLTHQLGVNATNATSASSSSVQCGVAFMPDLSQHPMLDKRSLQMASSNADLSPTMLRYKAMQAQQAHFNSLNAHSVNSVAPYATTSLIQNMIKMPPLGAPSANFLNGVDTLSRQQHHFYGNKQQMHQQQQQQHQQHLSNTYSDGNRTGSEYESHVAMDEGIDYIRRSGWTQNLSCGKPLTIGEFIPPPPLDPPPTIASLHEKSMGSLPLSLAGSHVSPLGGAASSVDSCSPLDAGIDGTGSSGLSEQSGNCSPTRNQSFMKDVHLPQTPQSRISPPRSHLSNAAVANNFRQTSISPKPLHASQLHHLQQQLNIANTGGTASPSIASDASNYSSQGKPGSMYGSGCLPSFVGVASDIEGQVDLAHLANNQGVSLHQHRMAVGFDDINNTQSLSPTNSSLQGEGAGSINSSVFASWVPMVCGAPIGQDVAEDCITDEALGSEDESISDSCSVCSDGDNNFLGEEEFASALAHAVEAHNLELVPGRATQFYNQHSSLPVQTNNNWHPLPYLPQQQQQQRKKRRHHRPDPRPVSPYSTDSNYSALPFVPPPRPYPKSDRRRQMKNYTTPLNGIGSAKQQPLPPTPKQHQQTTSSGSSSHPYYDLIPLDQTV